MENNAIIVCRLCLTIVESEKSSHKIETEMLETCLPELDLNSSENPIICRNCDELLKQLYAFKSRCLETEDKIINYKMKYETQIVNLSLLIDSTENSKLLKENEIKIEPGLITPVKVESDIKTEDLEPIINIKVEEGSNDKFQFVDCGFDAVKGETIEDLENENGSENENLQWYTCDICSYQTKWRHHVKRHKQIHEVSPESKLTKKYKCLKCGFISNYKHEVHKHSVLEHGNWFKCEQCEYQTKWKKMYNQHLLRHQGGQIWHKCERCFYKTKWKYHLKRHMTTHD